MRCTYLTVTIMIAYDTLMRRRGISTTSLQIYGNGLNDTLLKGRVRNGRLPKHEGGLFCVYIEAEAILLRLKAEDCLI